MTASTGDDKPPAVHVFRALIAQRHLAVLVCAAALLLRLVVPSGYMIAAEHGRFAITLCPGMVMTPTPMNDTAMAGMHGMRHATGEHGKAPGHSQAEMPCAFAGLALAGLAATDPIQLAALIAFVLAIVTRAPVLPWRPAPPFLRPPLRGPPLLL